MECGLPTSIIDIAILWTAVDNPLALKIKRHQRAESDNRQYPSWSWPSVQGPVDFLISQRWRADADGLMAWYDRMERDQLPADDPNILQSTIRGLLTRLDLTHGMSDEPPFRSEVTWVGIQDGERLRKICPSQDITTTARSSNCPNVRLLIPPPPTEILHLEAQVVRLQHLWDEGGKVITSTTKSWYTDIDQVLKQSKKLSFFVSWIFAPLFDKFTVASWRDWRDIVPDRDQRELLQNLGFVYDELTPETLTSDGTRPDLKDPSEIYVVLLSRVRSFPPSFYYWQYSTPRMTSWAPGSWGLFKQWGLLGEPWATMNVMLVKFRDDGLAERVCVGHVNAKFFEMAHPQKRYLHIA